MCQSILRYLVAFIRFTKYGNGSKQQKISRVSRRALRPALGAFLMDIGGKSWESRNAVLLAQH